MSNRMARNQPHRKGTEMEHRWEQPSVESAEMLPADAVEVAEDCGWHGFASFAKW